MQKCGNSHCKWAHLTASLESCSRLKGWCVEAFLQEIALCEPKTTNHKVQQEWKVH